MNPSTVNISELPSVELEMRAQLPKTPCIYFAINSWVKVQYIGQSINPRKRWLRHHRYKKLSKMKGIRIAWLKVSCRDLLPEVEKALIDWFKPPLNRLVATTSKSKSNISAYRLELPDGLRTQFKGMTAMNGTNMKDALIHFIEWYVGKQQLPPENKLLNVGIGQKEIMQSGIYKESPNIPELMNAYILLNYKGIGEKQLVEMANDCQVTPAQVQAVLRGQPVNDQAARIFSDKLKMPVEDFVAQYPVVKP